MGATVLFVNSTKIYQFKAKNDKIKKISLVLRKYFRRLFSQQHTKIFFLLIIKLLILVVLSISINI